MADAASKPFNYLEFRTERARRSLRTLPSLVAQCFKLVWSAGRREFIAATSLQLVGGVGVALQLLLGRELLGRLVEDGDVADFGSVLPVLLGLAAVSAAVSFATHASALQQQLMGSLVANHTLEQIHAITTRVDLLAFESPGFHDRLQRAMANAMTRPVQLTTVVLRLISSSVTIAGIAAALFVIQPIFVAVVFAAFVPSWIATTAASRANHAFSVEQTERDRRRLYLSQLLTGRGEAKEVRAFNLSGFLSDRHDNLAYARVDDLRKLLRMQLRLRLIGSLLTSLLTVAAIGVLVLLLINDRMEVAGAVSAAAAVVLLGQRLQTFASGATSIYEASLFVEDFTSFLELEPAIEANRPRGKAPSGFRRLVVEDVSFTYPSGRSPALSGISMEVNAGEIIALVGENGSGKTTLAKLLAGLWTPDSGRILWDDVDIAGVDPEELRAGIAVIFQDFVKYQLTAADNVAMGRHERFDDVAGIEAAVGRAGANFAFDLPAGLDTRLGPQYYGGTELSVGQWQRMALARAFFRDCPFIVLDEPTAALDPRAEHELFDNIRSLAAGRTVLLISHRFSSVRSADRIYVLGDGRIVETGTHEKLMRRAGTYAELFTLQASAYVSPLP